MDCVFAPLQTTSLAGYIAGSDFAPTTQQMEVYQRYRRSLSEYEARMAEIRGQDIAAFNELLRAKGIGGVITDPGIPLATDRESRGGSGP